MKATDRLMFEQCKLLLNDVDIQLWTFKDMETYGYVNKAHADFIGKRIEEIESRKLEDVLNSKEAFGCTSSNMRAWKDKEKVVTKEWITNSLGEPRLLNITKTPILDEEDEVRFVVCKAYDITVEEERKKKFEINKQQYMAIVENQKHLICKYLPSSELIFVNQAYCDFFDKKYEDLIGTNFSDLLPKELHSEVKEYLNSFSVEEPIKTNEHIGINSKGEVFWQRWTDQAFFNDNGEIIEFQAECVDITELKEKEKILKLRVEERDEKISKIIEYDKLKTEFFGNISHELRTPLNLIHSTLQLIDYRVENNMLESKHLKKTHGIIKQNCYRLLRLINNLIDITKIDSGYFNINPRNYNIISIVEDITLSVAEYVKNKNIRLLFDTDVEEKIMACDPDQIERIILNLLSNAIKFTKAGGDIVVTIHDRQDSIDIMVKDTGIGIPKDKINMIFMRFRQIDKSFTRNHEGSGIGLSLTKSLVKMHGGEIEVRSEYGKGSEFVIHLPVKVLKNDGGEMYNSDIKSNYVESINIEFSDIYSIR